MSIIKNSQNKPHEFSVFLTIGIPTYNRAEKLKRLLRQFSLLNSYLDIKKWNIEILVSDNCSSDSTPSVVAEAYDELVSSGYLVSSYRQEKNLGLDGNSLFVINNAKGKYLWFFSDDDILIPANISSLFEDIKQIEPGVCLSNFIQPPYTENNTIFLSQESEEAKILTNPVESIRALKKYPKLTNYVIARSFFLDSNYSEKINEIVERCSGQYYLFLAFSVLAYFSSGKVLIRKASIAKCDDDYLCLEYSPRVFENLNAVLKETLIALEQEQYVKIVTRKERFYLRLRNSLKFLLLHYQGKITLSAKVLSDEEVFIKNSPLWLRLHPLCIVPYIKLNLIWALNKK